eukprot:Gb_19627 [translate_table: standard]
MQRTIMCDQGLTFDPETGATLHIELARANSRIKRTGAGRVSAVLCYQALWDGGHGSIDKKIRGPIGVPGIYDKDGVGETVHVPGTIHSGSCDMSTQSGGTMGASSTGHDGNLGMHNCKMYAFLLCWKGLKLMGQIGCNHGMDLLESLVLKEILTHYVLNNYSIELVL